MKAPIRVYSTDGSTIQLAAEVSDYESCIFKRSRSSVGEFSVVINGKLPKAQEFIVGRLVWLAPTKSRVGVITKIIKGKDGTTNKWTVKGIEAKGITAWREIQYTGMSHYTVNSNAETVIKSAITRFLGIGAETDRQVGIVNVTTSLGVGDTYLMSERFSNLADAIEDCSAATGVWWRFEFNASTGKLDVIVTDVVDRTTTQTATPPAPFSEKFQTVKTLDWTEDQTDFYNVAIMAGSGEDTARVISTVGSGSGWNRREKFFDARDLTNTTDLNTRGASNLSSVSETIGIDITAMTKSQLIADQDYFLGDIVTVSAFDVEQDVPIIEISESWNTSGYEVDLTFGTVVKTRRYDIKKVESETFLAVSV